MTEVVSTPKYNKDIQKAFGGWKRMVNVLSKPQLIDLKSIDVDSILMKNKKITSEMINKILYNRRQGYLGIWQKASEHPNANEETFEILSSASHTYIRQSVAENEPLIELPTVSKFE